MKELSKGQKLAKELSYEKKNYFSKAKQEELNNCFSFAEDYKKFWDEYKAIDKEELEKKIAQCYCDYFYFRKELEVGIKFNPAPEEYWATKQNVLFEQYGIMWHSPAELNTQTLGKEYCEYMPEVWVPSEIVSLRKPADSTLLLPWTHIEVELCHTVHDFTMTNRTYSESKLIPKENVREGSNLISFFDSFYDIWGNINIDHVDKYFHNL